MSERESQGGYQWLYVECVEPFAWNPRIGSPSQAISLSVRNGSEF